MRLTQTRRLRLLYQVEGPSKAPEVRFFRLGAFFLNLLRASDDAYSTRLIMAAKNGEQSIFVAEGNSAPMSRQEAGARS